MIVIKFDKNRAREILDAIKGGKPIGPGGGDGWEANDLLAVAGALACVAMAKMPEAKIFPEEGDTEEQLKLKVIEREHDFANAISGHAWLTGAIINGSYDYAFEPYVEAQFYYQESDGWPELVALKGRRERGN